MEWRVENALSRDVERQHLNKILREIEARIKELGTAASTTEITRIIERTVGGQSGALSSVSVNIHGDVEGSGSTNSSGRINIEATIDPSKLGIQDAPVDGNRYWRVNGTWEQINPLLSSLQYIDGPGLVSIDTWGDWFVREIVGAEGEIDVVDGDGGEGNPTVGLADLENTGEGEGGVKLYTRDAKGRIEGDEDADTDNLPEGVDNLYFTEQRARDAAVADEIDPLVTDVAPSQRAVADALENVVGIPGPPGKDGQIRFTGNGPPGTIVGAEPGDTYMDLDTGDIYKLT